MQKAFSKDTSFFGVEGNFDIIRHVLNSCDYMLDIVPSDSIMIEAPSQALIKEESDDYSPGNSLEVNFLIDEKKC